MAKSERIKENALESLLDLMGVILKRIRALTELKRRKECVCERERERERVSTLFANGVSSFYIKKCGCKCSREYVVMGE